MAENHRLEGGWPAVEFYAKSCESSGAEVHMQ
jgi:hypothetical protein